jgi:hypothetical protein
LYQQVLAAHAALAAAVAQKHSGAVAAAPAASGR